MSKLTYTASTEPGQRMTLRARIEIVKGWNGIVKRDGKTVCHGPLYSTRHSADHWAVAKAKEYRDYRAKHGIGLEEIAERKIAVRRAEMRMRARINDKAMTMFDLLRPIVSDMDLVRDDLPAQALARIDAARALIAFVDTDQA